MLHIISSLDHVESLMLEERASDFETRLFDCQNTRNEARQKVEISKFRPLDVRIYMLQRNMIQL
jgi:hypothetical protein